MNTKELKKFLLDRGLRPLKSLGQNFLIDQAISDQIVELVKPFKPSCLLEIGPGAGALTWLLKKQFSCPLVLVELDKSLASYWKGQGFQVLQNDILKVNFQDVLKKDQVWVSNLPYLISSSVVVKCCLEASELLKAMVFMFQKEVAQRIVSKPRQKSYGLLSVMAQVFWNVKSLLKVSPKQFYPSPQVASQIVLFKKQSCPILANDNFLFLKFLKTCFSNRRKFLISNLKNSSMFVDQKLGQNLKQMSKNHTGLAVQKIWDQLGLDFKCRAEELTPQQFVKLFLEWKRLLHVC